MLIGDEQFLRCVGLRDAKKRNVCLIILSMKK